MPSPTDNTPAPVSVANPLTIVVEGQHQVCTSFEAVRTFLFSLRTVYVDLATTNAKARIPERDAKLRLGHALNQVRPRFPYGQWETLLDAMNLNRKTTESAMRVARHFTDPDGRLDPAKVEAARAKLPEHNPSTLTLGQSDSAPPASQISFEGLKSLASLVGDRAARMRELASLGTAPAGNVPRGTFPDSMPVEDGFRLPDEREPSESDDDDDLDTSALLGVHDVQGRAGTLHPTSGERLESRSFGPVGSGEHGERGDGPQNRPSSMPTGSVGAGVAGSESQRAGGHQQLTLIELYQVAERARVTLDRLDVIAERMPDNRRARLESLLQELAGLGTEFGGAASTNNGEAA